MGVWLTAPVKQHALVSCASSAGETELSASCPRAMKPMIGLSIPHPQIAHLHSPSILLPPLLPLFHLIRILYYPPRPEYFSSPNVLSAVGIIQRIFWRTAVGLILSIALSVQPLDSLSPRFSFPPRAYR